MSITAKFIKEFDPLNETHVAWFSEMCDMGEKFGTVDLVQEVNKNPLNITLESRDALDWPHIHFCISAVYAKAVVRGKAFIPGRE